MHDITRSPSDTASNGSTLPHLLPCNTREQFAVQPDELQNPLLAPTVNVEDPAYAWPHRYLERRRKCNELLNRFYHQISHGCENPNCRTPSCLNHQKRSSKGPFRPYSLLSARALATFLASQDCPERYLCPNRISQPSESGETILSYESHEPPKRNKIGHVGSPQKAKRSVHWREESTGPHHGKPNGHPPTLAPQAKAENLESVQVPKSKIYEKGAKAEVKKDATSFTQALFDTFSFDVFHWAEVPEGYSVWAPWASEASAQDRVHADQTFVNQQPVEPDHRTYGPLSAPGQKHKDAGNLLNSQKTSADQCSPLEDANYANNAAQSIGEIGAHQKISTNVRQHLKLALDKRYHGASLTISDSIPKYLLNRPRPPFFYRMGMGGVQPPMALGQFSLENTAALVNSIKNLSGLGTYSGSQFLRFLGRPTAAVQLFAFQLGCATRDQRNIAFATQSLVYVLSNAKCLLNSFEGRAAQSKGFFDFLRIEYAFRNLLEVDFHPSNLLSSLWIHLSETEQILRSQIREGCYIPFQAVFHGLEDCPSESDEAGKGALVHIMNVVVAALVALVRPCHPKEWAIMQRLRSSGRIVPRDSEWPCNNDRRKHLLDTMDIFNDEMALKLVKKLVRVTMMHCMAARYLRPQENVLEHWIAKCAANRTDWIKGSVKFNRDWSSEFVQYPFIYILVDWLRAIILKEWDGKAIILKTSPVWEAAEFLSRLYHHGELLALRGDYFHMPFLVERLNILEMPAEWIRASVGEKSVHILSYPFLFPPHALAHYFRAINHAAMFEAYESTLLSSRVLSLMNYRDRSTQIGTQRLVDGVDIATNRFFVLEISRENILTDALDQLWRRQRREIMKPLKVRLGTHEGEEGVDHGGVQQEFFRLAIAEAFRPEYGMFVTDDQSRMSWFQSGSLEPLYKFQLLGLLVSLAVYNGLTLPFTFPLALYRRLLGQSNRTTQHIEDGWPVLAKGLRDLLHWEDGDVEDVFMRSYEFSVEIPGSTISVDMESGKATEGKREPGMVNSQNRARYVQDYISWLTVTSINPQYRAFAQGFYSCLSRRATSIFGPKTLKLLVEGTQDIDVAALQSATRYDGYNADDDTIKVFWHIARSFSPEQMRKLLEFVTASDRVPFGGVRTIDFTIQRNGSGDDGRLPSSSTCFNRLLLPEYSSRELMEEKLCTAIENSQGFGVV